jgi:hypothetical protein
VSRTLAQFNGSKLPIAATQKEEKFQIGRHSAPMDQWALSARLHSNFVSDWLHIFQFVICDAQTLQQPQSNGHSNIFPLRRLLIGPLDVRGAKFKLKTSIFSNIFRNFHDNFTKLCTKADLWTLYNFAFGSKAIGRSVRPETAIVSQRHLPAILR